MTNIAEILKNCPRGTKLYSPICGECEFSKIAYDDDHIEVIACDKSHRFFSFYDDGRYIQDIGECLLFPSKDNRDWSKFGKLKFKKGDFVHQRDFVCLFHGLTDNNAIRYLAFYHIIDEYFCINEKPMIGIGHLDKEDTRLATEEEKQKLLKIIDENGYVWDEEKLELRKKEDKFKAGDEIINRYDTQYVTYIIKEVTKHGYFVIKKKNGNESFIPIECKSDYILLKSGSNKDYSLLPFEKVLVRYFNGDVLMATLHSIRRKSGIVRNNK